MDHRADATATAAAAFPSKKAQLLPRSLTFHPHQQRRLPVSPLWRHRGADDPKRHPAAVLYTTSLRSIRRTHHDCAAVRAILRGLRVAVDDRDVSMDSNLKHELLSLLPKPRPFSLPQLFIAGKHIGGADEVRQLHESGELVKLLDGVPVQDPGYVCAGCGGARFVPCSTCSGSRKVFVEEEGRMRRCEDCNENGLVRCPNCCSY